jgi:thioredoxin reductase
VETENIVIIGAGPSGIAAAIQLKRYGLDAAIMEGNKIGGLLRNANLVENYPGFPDGISGQDIIPLLQSHLERLAIMTLMENVLELDYDGSRFIMRTDKRVLYPKTVIVASGTKPVEFSDIVIPDDIKNKAFYEVAPILNEKGKRMAIVGAGDAAFDYALNLSRNNQVTILNRKRTVDCLQLLRQRAQLSTEISYCGNTSISGIAAMPSGEICLECVSGGETTALKAHYLIFAIGRQAKLDFLSDRLKNGIAQLEADGRIYFIGDVKNGIFRQASIAIGDGIMAAMKIYIRIRKSFPCEDNYQ